MVRGKNLLDGVEDGGGIIHHAKGIDHRPEFLFLKATTNLCSEARTHEEHCFARANPKPWIRYVNNRPKLHSSFITIISSC